MFCKQILGENRRRKAENPGRGVFRVCSADSERICARVFNHEREVPVKGVYFCFASETDLGTDVRVGKTGHDLAVHKFNQTQVVE